MLRSTWIGLHVLMLAMVVHSVWLDGWSWWLLAWLPIIAALAIGDLCVVGGFTLDKDGQPLTGRDADRYARSRARMCAHERAAWDGWVDEQRERRRRSHS